MIINIRKLDMPAEKYGSVYLHSMPGRRETIEEFLAAADARGITCIACLTSMAEIREKSPSYLKALENGLIRQTILAFPIEDFGVPENLEDFSDYIGKLSALVSEGNNLLIHCGAGIGRTGLCAICLLRVLGISEAQATSLVRNSGSGPETEEQIAFVRRFAEIVKKLE